MAKHLTREEIIQRTAEAVIPEDPRIPLNEFQAAKLLNISVHTLRRSRWSGGGIPFTKLSDNGSVRYCRADIDARIAAGRRTSTASVVSQQGGASRVHKGRMTSTAQA